MKKLFSIACALAVVGALPPYDSRANAQGSSALRAGDRVRVTSPKGAPGAEVAVRLTGELVTITGETIVVRTSSRSEPKVIPLTDLTSVERSAKPTGLSLGAKVGLVAGVAIGYAVGASSEDYGDGVLRSFSSQEKAIAGAVLGGTLGLIAGAWIAPGESWEKIPPSRFQLANMRRPGREMRLRLIAWRF